MFDPDKFMDQPADAGSTVVKPIPAGEYTAMIEDIAKPRVVSGQRGDSVVVDVIFKLMDVSPALASQLGRTNFTVKRGYFIDVTPNGGPDMSEGKNVDLNRLRAAVNQNSAGWTMGKLKGAGPLKVMTGLRPDKNNTGNPLTDVFYADVKAVGKVG